MHFSRPPSADDLMVLATDIVADLPEELSEHCETLSVVVEEMADEALEDELELEDPFDLILLFRSGKQIAPGVERKIANDQDALTIFRRPLLDLWCDSCDDLPGLVRQLIIEELGHRFDFSEEQIDEMVAVHNS
jgi:predicted Zn-dependent protease with MMP-like domain